MKVVICVSMVMFTGLMLYMIGMQSTGACLTGISLGMAIMDSYHINRRKLK